MEVVINICYGDFDLSSEAFEEYKKRVGSAAPKFSSQIKRDDPVLVEVVKLFGRLSGGEYSKLAVVEIPDDVKWEIDEYDGRESVVEISRVWNENGLVRDVL